MSKNVYYGSIPDLIIVGSGVAGAVLANKLSSMGLSICILEAGKINSRKESVNRYRDSWYRNPQSAYERQPHALFPDKDAFDPYLLLSKESDEYNVDYLRQVGGSTWHWTGITPRFLPSDFELKSRYGVGIDWPINYKVLESYYLLAEQELGVSGDSNDDHGSPRSGPYPMPPIEMPYSDQVIARYLKNYNLNVKVLPAARNSEPYSGRPACCGNNSCTPICPIGAQYSAEMHINNAIKNGVRLIENAVACNINVNASNYIDSIDYKTSDAAIHNIKGRYYVLACNGIETPKLLLISRSEKTPSGVANSSGLVGKRLMDHPTVAMEFFMSEPLYVGRGPQVVSTIDHGRDGIFRTHHSAGKIFLLNTADIQSHVTMLIEGDKDWDNINKRIEYFASHYGFVGVELEQLPDINNYIRPSENELDAIGIPKPVVHVKFDDYLRKSAEYFRNFMEIIINHFGAEKIRYIDIGKLWPNHPMGTTCMGNNSETSVIDKNCRSHEHPNLFIIGSSNFPTGGTANPTLTIAALTLRLADYLNTIIQTEDL